MEETRIDFLQRLQFDLAVKILMSLDDPSDLIRASAVSRFWFHFVITNGLCKQLCLRLFPQLSTLAYVIEPGCGTKITSDVGSSKSVEWQALNREHKACAFLARTLTATTFTASDCIAGAISASSTDNYPQESILNTLDFGDTVLGRVSYWSSKGQRDPAVPETLIYKLVANLCVITEISVQPFQAFFQPGHPTYSAKSVRFRMGHPISPIDGLGDWPSHLPVDDKFLWTYTSPEFSMAQENCLQKFKLPEPVLCIGGFVQIELLGRVQTQETDGLFYICVCRVEIMGQPLFPVFDVEILDPSGKFILKYYRLPENRPLPVSPYSEFATSPNLNLFRENWRGLEQLLNILHGNVPDLELDDRDDDDDDNDLDLIIL